MEKRTSSYRRMGRMAESESAGAIKSESQGFVIFSVRVSSQWSVGVVLVLFCVYDSCFIRGLVFYATSKTIHELTRIEDTINANSSYC
jgi:hypothetical protein